MYNTGLKEGGKKKGMNEIYGKKKYGLPSFSAT